MYTFSQLHNEIKKLLLKNTKKKEYDFLTYLNQQVTDQEIYYNSIPNNIRTTNTIKYIIQKLTFKLDQFLFSKNIPQITINAKYINNICNDLNTDIIDVVYLTNNQNVLENQLADMGIQNATYEIRNQRLSDRVTFLEDQIQRLVDNIPNV